MRIQWPAIFQNFRVNTQVFFSCNTNVYFFILSFTVELPHPKPLQEAQIHVIGNKQCTCLLRVPDVSKYDNATCAGDLNGGKDACQVGYF